VGETKKFKLYFTSSDQYGRLSEINIKIITIKGEMTSVVVTADDMSNEGL